MPLLPCGGALVPVYTAAVFQAATFVCAPAVCQHSNVAHLMNPSVDVMTGTGVSVSVPAISAPPYYRTRIPVCVPRQHVVEHMQDRLQVWVPALGIGSVWRDGMLVCTPAVSQCHHTVVQACYMHTCRVPLLSCTI